MHSHFRISWAYDTVMMIKGRMTPVLKKGGSCDKYITENQKGSLLIASNQHWVVSFWLTDF